MGVAAEVVLGLGAVIAFNAATQDASAATFRVTPAQLQINQRISRAAVRRSNESLGLLAPIRTLQNQPSQVLGWRSQDLRDGAVTAPKLAEPLREGQPRWAVVAAGASTLTRAKGATAAAKLADVGLYTVTFDRDVSACALQATIADPGTTALTTGGEVGAWRSASDPKIVTVRTADSAGAATNALPLSGGRSGSRRPLIVSTRSAAGDSRAVRVP
jgi:hypothetical protein